jgi:predicted RNase H-like HicB family nuclease
VARGQTIRVSREAEVQCGAIKLKVIVHEAEEGGYWAAVPSIPGCATQGETFEQVSQNLYEAVEGCLSVDVTTAQVLTDRDRVLEIAI